MKRSTADRLSSRRDARASEFWDGMGSWKLVCCANQLNHYIWLWGFVNQGNIGEWLKVCVK